MDKLAITRILKEVNLGNPEASTELFEFLYQELRKMAKNELRGQRTELTATGLVHEAFIRLFGSESTSWENRRHFFGSAARAMRRILIDKARSRLAKKRGGDRLQITLHDALNSHQNTTADDLLDLNQAIEKLESEDVVLAQIVELRFFAGQTMEEIAAIQDMSISSIERKWRLARAFLIRQLQPRSSNDNA